MSDLQSSAYFKRNDIQGLRALAVASVVLFHAFPLAFPGGYVGVDVFFVISGYLITGSIYKDMASGDFSFLNFYRKRIRRILPAMLFVTSVTVAVGFQVLYPEALVDLSKMFISAILSFSNIYFWRTSGYFSTNSDYVPLLHTWSLSVEEQFYLLFPVFLLALVRWTRPLVVPVLAMCFLGSLVLSELVLSRSTSAAYFLLPTRAFELLAGAILAISQARLDEGRAWAREPALLTGLALVLAPVFLFSSDTRFPGLNALYPTIGATLLLLAGTGGGAGIFSRLLALPPLRFIGDISYSLYLWHWPILAYGRILYGPDLPFSLAAAAIVLAFGLSVATYRFIEQPFHRLGTAQFPFLRAGGAAMLLGCVAMAPVIRAQGFPSRFTPESLALFAALDDHNPKRASCHNDNGKPMSYADNCVFGSEADDRLLVVWGDSHGAELAYALGQRSAEIGENVMEITSSSCPPALDYAPAARPHCVRHNRATLAAIVADPRVRSVVLTLNAEAYETDGAAFRSGFERVIAALSEAGKHVILVGQQPSFRSDPPVALGYASSLGRDIANVAEPVARYEAVAGGWNAYLNRLRQERRTGFVSVRDVICSPTECPAYDPAHGALYFDRAHISLAGANLLVRPVLEELQRTRTAG